MAWCGGGSGGGGGRVRAAAGRLLTGARPGPPGQADNRSQLAYRLGEAKARQSDSCLTTTSDRCEWAQHFYLPVRRELSCRPAGVGPELRGRDGRSAGPSTARGWSTTPKAPHAAKTWVVAIAPPRSALRSPAARARSGRASAEPRVASISRSALIRTSAAVARSTASSLMHQRRERSAAAQTPAQ
jgi:hypothetical protein